MAVVADVVPRLHAVEASAEASDGIVFGRLYREVTESVALELASSTFANASFLEQLDVAFADLFFTAFDALADDPAIVPPAWAPLFAARSRRGIAPLQFAFAGMNAHINRDLPLVLVATFEIRGVELRR